MGVGPCLGFSLGRDFPGGGVGGRFPPYGDISCHLVSAFSSNLASLFVMHASDYQAYAGVEVLSCIYTDSLPCLTALNSVSLLACDLDRKAWCLSWTFQVGVVS